MTSGDNPTPEEREERSERYANIVRWRRQRVSFEDIGKRIYPDKTVSKQTVFEMYQRALALAPAREVKIHREEQAELLDQLIDEAYAIAQREHLAVSQGRVVRLGRPIINADGEAEIDDGQGEPVLDDGPKLQAIGEIRKLLERMAKVRGSDTPVKQELEHSGAMNYTINNVDVSKLS